MYKFCEFCIAVKTLIGRFKIWIIKKIAGCNHIAIGINFNGVTINSKSLLAECYFNPEIDLPEFGTIHKK